MNCRSCYDAIFERNSGFWKFFTRDTGSYAVRPVFENTSIEASSVPDGEAWSEGTSLSTNSDNILKASIKILRNMGIDVSESRFELSLNDIVKRLDSELPLIVETENVDFLIISTDNDKEDARKTLHTLAANVNVTGTLYNDSVPIGADLFESFELFASAATKLIFYLTDDFVRDDFCSRLVSLVYLYNRADLMDKAVPILAVDSLEIELPRCLQLVDKLWLGSSLQMEVRWPHIWTIEVRRERLIREQRMLQERDSRRLTKLRILLAELYGVVPRD